MKNKRYAGWLLALLLIAPVSLALTLDQARSSGRVGETLSGYLAARQNDRETQQLVARVNAGRQQQYQRLAQQNNLTTHEVASLAGKKLVERAAAGEYVRGIN
ncbi:hypothetical protein BL250_06730 [Erwinia sp. OLTSP20]|uniref:YdbL family protein n=1 Tax=unclassified Erwinia TaxID=2622719 RepID=UPI000C183DC2|nr:MULTISPECIES: DUF1318 domain-containing protein [unclassified Erwinia]PIJ48582.1 hypothetical protein BV501_16565 [Erwinia sp. OAMSP11]PIJ68766.1 hypothetical protein BK416_16040 [Erwinia sp. OLSSP12]PIJ79330.1 hypothetical protein BLD47_14515 [Erwinia sp. OLCASP19]PIJ79513.1 hypothetical protein BLD46_16925 [Erwinia sp. OLMTSP26]PIJ81714.1 hypothetical protein BLD49_16180 [Erwinia sp. OLMDSP33]